MYAPAVPIRGEMSNHQIHPDMKLRNLPRFITMLVVTLLLSSVAASCDTYHRHHGHHDRYEQYDSHDRHKKSKQKKHKSKKSKKSKKHGHNRD